MNWKFAAQSRTLNVFNGRSRSDFSLVQPNRCEERWLSGRKRRFAKSVSRATGSAGSNPVRSAWYPHHRCFDRVVAVTGGRGDGWMQLHFFPRV